MKVRLKPGALPRVWEWAAELKRRRDEVNATLRDEGVILESVFLDQTDDGDFLIYYMKAHSLDEAARVAQHSRHAIDRFHQDFKRETWESRTSLTPLIEFSQPDIANPS
ncbi:MAG TPA: DUF6176 family protein [Gaiellaceae bacterium]|nr:DUF6176 family protein [Gaiellaceae bacterium]